MYTDILSYLADRWQLLPRSTTTAPPETWTAMDTSDMNSFQLSSPLLGSRDKILDAKLKSEIYIDPTKPDTMSACVEVPSYIIYGCTIDAHFLYLWLHLVTGAASTCSGLLAIRVPGTTHTLATIAVTATSAVIATSFDSCLSYLAVDFTIWLHWVFVADFRLSSWNNLIASCSQAYFVWENR